MHKLNQKITSYTSSYYYKNNTVCLYTGTHLNKLSQKNNTCISKEKHAIVVQQNTHA